MKAAYAALESLRATEGIEKPMDDVKPATFTSPIDNAPMILIPAGQFLYGSREDDKMAGSSEKPQRVIDLPEFYIDKYPVTNELYCRFLNDRAPDKKTLKEWIELTGSYKKERCRIKLQGKKFRFEEGYKTHPVLYVTWYGADAYAKWAGKQLPTEQQWEKAARGTEGIIYPWGDKFDINLCNSVESGLGCTTAVDRFCEGKSPYGCFDMAGNVWEWTDSWYDKDEDCRAVRGGSWRGVSGLCRCAFRGYLCDPGSGFNSIGFRCARI